ncbi:MAG: hypothetical protein IPJ33_20410 [Gammaproteobacteria bacterium]|jgi:hypothetical protein|nr:hypothetical protein [Gammaproteobacteria bacterium]MBP6053151.1 hypothetical protein [Pseudomonadales bacterium]MBK6584546.1 hypothetical protein [Gammaproteobacteria bacterium]MBK7169202.1 hypothetical protein [Gammaproteobacteria bacterium]MBK7519950.1 hypothetical protein [Gammaproteobacteria bacterium]
MAKPNYSFAKRQRDLAKKKKKEEKKARKAAAGENPTADENGSGESAASDTGQPSEQ